MVYFFEIECIQLMAIQTELYSCAVSLTGEIIADDLNGVITRHLTAMILYDATLVVDPVACIDADC